MQRSQHVPGLMAVMGVVVLSMMTAVRGEVVGAVGAGVQIRVDFGPVAEKVVVGEGLENKYFQVAKGTVDAFMEHGTVDVGGVPVFAEFVDIRKLEPIKDKHSVGELGDLYRLCYYLSDATGEGKYAAFADAAIEAVLHENQPRDGIPFWGEDHHVRQPGPMGKWFRLAPYVCERHALGWWIQGIGDKVTGEFNRHTNCHAVGAPYARHGGYRMSWWVHGYRATWVPEYLEYTGVLTEFYETRRGDEGWVSGGPVGQTAILTQAVWPLVAHIPNDHPVDAAVKRMLGGNAEKMLRVAADGPGFNWEQLANTLSMYHAHLHELAAGNEERADRLRAKFLELATTYARLDPEAASEAKEVAQQIDILLSAHALEPEGGYLEAAKRVGDFAIDKYYNLGPIPRSGDGLEIFETKQAKTDMLPLQLFRLGVVVGEADYTDQIGVMP